MDRYLAYDPTRLVELRLVLDAAVWHLAATRFEHAYCEDHRAAIQSIRPRLEELRDAVLQPVIASDALATFLASGPTMSPIVVDGAVLDTPTEIAGHLQTNADAEDVGEYGVVVATMLGLRPPEAAAYWAALGVADRDALIVARPDLAGKALLGGAVMTNEQLRRLDRANAFALFTEEFGVAVNAKVTLRWATVAVSGGYSVVAMKMSDGTVQVAVVADDELGVGVAAEGGGTSASATAGVFVSSEHVFVFDSEADAEAAISELHAAVADHSVVDRLTDVADTLLGPWLNFDNDFERFVAATWVSNGAVRRVEGGVYGEVAANVESELAAAGIESRVSVAAYDTDTTDRATATARSGILITGAIGVDVRAAVGAGGTASAGGSFSVEAYRADDGDEYATVTVEADAASGVVVELVDAAGVDIAAAAEGGAHIDVTVTLPLSADAVGGLVASLVSGHVPTALRELRGSAEVTVAAGATLAGSTDASIDAEVVDVSIEHSRTDTANLVTLHRLPGGEPYSRNELDAAIDAGLAPASTTGYSPDALVYDLHGLPVAARVGNLLVPIDRGLTGSMEPLLGPSLLDLVEVSREPAVTTAAAATPATAALAPAASRHPVITGPDGLAVGAIEDGEIRVFDPASQLLVDAEGSLQLLVTADGFVPVEVRLEIRPEAGSEIVVGEAVVDE